MHDQLRTTASEAGYTESNGKLQILSCGAEDTPAILSSLNNNQVDTIISILTLCSVPNPQATIKNLIHDVLKPGGQFLYYEHVLSPLKDVAWWQRFWAPLWAFWLDGCRMDQPTHAYVEEVPGRGDEDVWKERSVWGKEGEPDSHLFWHRVGRYVKA
ncbi:Methyltransferase-like protein 7B [Leucoagaricus sp. SymC.cos]|nr:Methyltransferase-like protein 7B [Leucoagaricus sp. SymC.cos]